MTDKGHLVSPDSVFDDGRAPDALRTIGEVARLVGVKPHVLRYWEEQFPMLRPLTRAGNRRYYRAEDVALVHAAQRHGPTFYMWTRSVSTSTRRFDQVGWLRMIALWIRIMPLSDRAQRRFSYDVLR